MGEREGESEREREKEREREREREKELEGSVYLRSCKRIVPTPLTLRVPTRTVSV